MSDSTSWVVTPHLGHELVTLIVGIGESAQTYSVHKKLLCQNSPAFHAAFTGQFEEAQTNAMELPDDDPDAFGLLVNWLYSGSFQPPKVPALENPHGNGPWGPDRHTKDKLMILYHHLLILADKYLIPALQQTCYERIRNTLGESGMPGLTFLAELCDAELANPRLKFYIAQVCAYWVRESALPGDLLLEFEGFMKERLDFAAYLARTIFWRMRLELKSPYLSREHPLLLMAFNEYNVQEKFTIRDKGGEKERKLDEFETAERMCEVYPKRSKGTKRSADW